MNETQSIPHERAKDIRAEFGYKSLVVTDRLGDTGVYKMNILTWILNTVFSNI